MAAEGRGCLIGGSGGCVEPAPGPYSIGWRESDAPKVIEGGLDNLWQKNTDVVIRTYLLLF